MHIRTQSSSRPEGLWQGQLEQSGSAPIGYGLARDRMSNDNGPGLAADRTRLFDHDERLLDILPRDPDLARDAAPLLSATHQLRPT